MLPPLSSESDDSVPLCFGVSPACCSSVLMRDTVPPALPAVCMSVILARLDPLRHRHCPGHRTSTCQVQRDSSGIVTIRSEKQHNVSLGIWGFGVPDPRHAQGLLPRHSILGTHPVSLDPRPLAPAQLLERGGQHRRKCRVPI